MEMAGRPSEGRGIKVATDGGNKGLRGMLPASQVTLCRLKNNRLSRLLFPGSRIKSANSFHHGQTGNVLGLVARDSCLVHSALRSAQPARGRGQRKAVGSCEAGSPNSHAIDISASQRCHMTAVLSHDCGSFCGIPESDREMPLASSAPRHNAKCLQTSPNVPEGAKSSPMDPLP